MVFDFSKIEQIFLKMKADSPETIKVVTNLLQGKMLTCNNFIIFLKTNYKQATEKTVQTYSSICVELNWQPLSTPF